MELEHVKWIAAVILLLLTLFFCSIPLCLQLRIRNSETSGQHKYQRVLSLISCCGGGIFLGTCLLHLFPEVQEQMTKVFELAHIKQVFPVSEFLMAFGFLLVLMIEQVVLALQHQRESEYEPLFGHQHSHGDVHNGNSHQTQYGSLSDGSDSSETQRSVHEDQSSHSPLRSAVLILALSLHSIFEGFAIGLQSSSENVWRILIAVLIHKSIIAFTLGLNLVNSRLTSAVIYRGITIFSSMSPIGIVIGSLIADIGSLPMAIASGILQGIATGTFLYVTFFEVLPHELNAKEDKIFKVLSLVFGFAVISFLVLYVPA